MSTDDLTTPAEAILSVMTTALPVANLPDLRHFTNWPKFLYLIHFAEKRHHAQHYLGCSYNLYERLVAHANGRGAKLTKALWEDKQDWQLAAIFIPKPSMKCGIFELETRAKQRHNSIAYCPVCQHSQDGSTEQHRDRTHLCPPGTLQYPLPFQVSATLLRKDS